MLLVFIEANYGYLVVIGIVKLPRLNNVFCVYILCGVTYGGVRLYSNILKGVRVCRYGFIISRGLPYIIYSLRLIKNCYEFPSLALTTGQVLRRPLPSTNLIAIGTQPMIFSRGNYIGPPLTPQP